MQGGSMTANSTAVSLCESRQPNTVCAHVKKIDKDRGRRIRDLRKARGLKVDEAAKLVGVEGRTFARWTAGGPGPGLPGLKRLADEFDTTTAYIMGSEAPESPDDGLARIEARLIEQAEKLDALLEAIDPARLAQALIVAARAVQSRQSELDLSQRELERFAGRRGFGRRP
jgi:transcriptional regulator with XRE-family HTH domain